MSTETEALAPVIKSVEVALPQQAAFELFTTGMGSWWPLATHSIAADTHEGRVHSTGLVFEPGLGGRIVETMSDGNEGEWGRVLEWSPYTSVSFSWNPTLEERADTTVTVSFSPLGDGSATRVELVHTRWERLGELGARLRLGYDSGWPGVLALFAASART